MFRGLFIVVVTLVALIATVVGVVGAGLHRIAAAQKEADANWQRPEPAPTPATNPATPAPVVADDPSPPAPVFNSIQLVAKDASLHGNLKLIDTRAGHPPGDPPKDERRLSKWQRRELMGGSGSLPYITGFAGGDHFAEWRVNVPKPAEYEVVLSYACPEWQAGGRFSLKVADRELSLVTEGTRSEAVYRVVSVGKLSLNAGGATLNLRADPTSMKSTCFMNLRGIQLIPTETAAAP